MIIEGDGLFAKRMSRGRCPSCDAKVEGNQCTVCKLRIIDSRPPSDKISDDTLPSEWEPDMHETWLSPTAEQIAEKEEKLSWSSAVSAIEAIVMEKLEDMEHGFLCQDYTEDDRKKVEDAWNRIEFLTRSLQS